MIFLMSTVSFVAGSSAGEDYTKNIEIVESKISVDHKQFPAIAYLYITLKNDGNKKVSNLTFQISYYSEGGYLMKKAVVKNALNEPIPQGEERKYRIRLKGDFVNIESEQYPYSQNEEVNEFDIKILKVALTSK